MPDQATAETITKGPDPFDGVDVYRFWRAEVKGSGHAIARLPTGDGGPVGDPQPGLYKTRTSKGGPFEGVKIWLVDPVSKQPEHRWRAGLGLVAIRGKDANRTIEGDKVIDLWAWCMAHPVSKAEYDHWLGNGTWPGEVPAPETPAKPSIAAQLAAAHASEAAEAAGVGHNSAPGASLDKLAALKAELEGYAKTCTAFIEQTKAAGGAKAKEDASAADNMADLIGDVKGGIARRLDELREELVAPHLKAQRDINATFKQPIEDGRSIADTLRRIANAWKLAEKNRLEAEAAAARKIEQDRLEKIRQEGIERRRIEADRAREAAEQQARELGLSEEAAAAEAAAIVPEPEAPPPAPIVVAAEPIKVSTGGQRGARRSLQGATVAVIVDYEKALAAFKNSEEVKALIQKLATKAVKAGLTIDGVEAREEYKV